MLFLSHYDNDHISGIGYLLQEGFRIKKIIAPLITPLVELAWLTGMTLNPNQLASPTEYRPLLSILSAYTDNFVQVEPIQEHFDDDIRILFNNNVNDNVEDITSNNLRNNIASNVTTMRLENHWQFTFFCTSYSGNMGT